MREQLRFKNRLKGDARSNSGMALHVKLKYLLTEYRGVVLLKVIEYLAYKVQYADFNTEDITEDFSDRIDPYIALELYVSLIDASQAHMNSLTAADYLDT